VSLIVGNEGVIPSLPLGQSDLKKLRIALRQGDIMRKVRAAWLVDCDRFIGFRTLPPDAAALENWFDTMTFLKK